MVVGKQFRFHSSIPQMVVKVIYHDDSYKPCKLRKNNTKNRAYRYYYIVGYAFHPCTFDFFSHYICCWRWPMFAFVVSQLHKIFFRCLEALFWRQFVIVTVSLMHWLRSRRKPMFGLAIFIWEAGTSQESSPLRVATPHKFGFWRLILHGPMAFLKKVILSGKAR